MDMVGEVFVALNNAALGIFIIMLVLFTGVGLVAKCIGA